MDGGAWWVAVHGVAKSQTRLSDFTFTLHFHALEKEMTTHSSVLAWRIQGTGQPGGLPYRGSHRVGHDWSDLAAAAATFYAHSSTYVHKSIWLQHIGQDKYHIPLFFYTKFNVFWAPSWPSSRKFNLACFRHYPSFIFIRSSNNLGFGDAIKLGTDISTCFRCDATFLFSEFRFILSFSKAAVSGKFRAITNRGFSPSPAASHCSPSLMVSKSGTLDLPWQSWAELKFHPRLLLHTLSEGKKKKVLCLHPLRPGNFPNSLLFLVLNLKKSVYFFPLQKVEENKRLHYLFENSVWGSLFRYEERASIWFIHCF